MFFDGQKLQVFENQQNKSSTLLSKSGRNIEV